MGAGIRSRGRGHDELEAIVSFSRWDDGARACVLEAQHLRQERGGPLSELHLLQGVLSARCDAAEVLAELGVGDVLAPVAEPAPPSSLDEPSRHLIRRLEDAVRMEATVRRHEITVTSCLLASVLLAGGAGPAVGTSAAEAVEQQGHEVEAVRAALLAHLDAARAEPAARSAD